MAIIYRITSDTLLFGKRVISAAKIDRDETRHRPDRPLSEPVWFSVEATAEPEELIRVAKRLLDA